MPVQMIWTVTGLHKQTPAPGRPIDFMETSEKRRARLRRIREGRKAHA